MFQSTLNQNKLKYITVGGSLTSQNYNLPHLVPRQPASETTTKHYTYYQYHKSEDGALDA
jgi:hypothetical protein